MYTIDFFLNKFEAIPEENFITDHYSNKEKTKFCALGFCGAEEGKKWTDECNALFEMVYEHTRESIAAITDGLSKRYTQPTPKQRLFAALYDVKLNGAVRQAQAIINELEDVG